MKLRYYMRGLGIGILVTAVLMGVTIHGKEEKLTDAQIIERAKELGMEEKYGSSVLADTVSDNQTVLKEQSTNRENETADGISESAKENISEIKTDTENDNQNNNDTDNNESITDKKDNPTENKTEDKADVKAEDKTEDKAEVKAEDKSEDEADVKAEDKTVDKTESEAEDSSERSEKQITVNSGDGSETVARKLKDAGLIEDAKVYDRFLCANGYDKKICTGTHMIPIGAGDEEIAKILTTKP